MKEFKNNCGINRMNSVTPFFCRWKFSICMFFITAGLLSCTADHDLDFSESPMSVKSKGHHISEEDAMNIASVLFPETRANQSYQIDYVLTDQINTTRAKNRPDTLAYIINRKNGGFVLVSTDNRISPILAYSEIGSFNINDSGYEKVYDNFLSKLESYYDLSSESDTVIDVPDDFMTSCVLSQPKTVRSWSQGSPYNAYVHIEHPNCKVGCVAIAAGQLMSRCKNDLSYHGEDFDFYSINHAVWDDSLEHRPLKTIPDRVLIDYTLEEGIDRIAKLLYWIGKDVNMNYGVEESSTYSSYARTLLQNTGYEVSKFMAYADSTVMGYIYQDYLIYVDGRWIKGTGGHAFIIDGGRFCWNEENNPNSGMRDIYVHCDWGDGGNLNGYYCGNIFEPKPGLECGNMKYFAVKDETAGYKLFPNH